MLLGQLDCALEIFGIGINLNAIGKHFLGKCSHLMPLVKHRLQGIINCGEQMLGVVVAPQQFVTLQAVKEFGL